VPLTLIDLPAGHVFETIVFSVDAERSRAYRGAVADALPLYEAEALVPPLALAALALGGLLNQVGLPPGSLHVNETVEGRVVVPVGASVECRATLAQRSQRGGWIVAVIEAEIRLDGATAVRARSTVLSPMGPS
jgi:hypothetical protein